MPRTLATFLALAFASNLTAQDAATTGSIISWEGSAFKDGDAFNVVATIGEKEVKLVWDGFAEPEFDFMDDKKKPHIQRDFLFKDKATVNAFRTISRRAEQCDAGEFGPIGQGVSIDVGVQSPPGKSRWDLHYFATPLHKMKARRLAGLPWELKELLIDQEVKTEVPPSSKFSERLRIFAGELEIYGVAFEALTEAAKEGRDLPVAELGKVFAPIPVDRYLAANPDNPENSEAIRGSLSIFEGVLAACLAPEHRSSLSGEDAGEGGVILFIDTCHGLEGLSFPLLRMAVQVPDCPVSLLSYESRAFLLHSLVGRRSLKGLDITDPCQLALSPEGELEIRQGEDDFAGSPETAARLEYLDRKNLSGVLLGLKAPPEKRIAMVTISSISLNRENRDHVKIDFFLDGKERVLEVNRIEGKWKPGKLWNKRDYYLIDNVYHNDTDFRSEDR